ncbi:hypothetical protein BG006_003507, partial [Podila minutissima]
MPPPILSPSAALNVKYACNTQKRVLRSSANALLVSEPPMEQSEQALHDALTMTPAKAAKALKQLVIKVPATRHSHAPLFGAHWLRERTGQEILKGLQEMPEFGPAGNSDIARADRVIEKDEESGSWKFIPSQGVIETAKNLPGLTEKTVVRFGKEQRITQPHQDPTLTAYWEDDEAAHPDPGELVLHVLRLIAIAHQVEYKYAAWFQGFDEPMFPDLETKEEEEEQDRDVESAQKLLAQLEAAHASGEPPKFKTYNNVTRPTKCTTQLNESSCY